MKGIILGCGSSMGVPSVARGFMKCDPNNKKNKRTRSSLLLQKDGVSILFDTPPEIRLQLFNSGFPPIQSVIYTHMHADHTAGINDIKPCPMKPPMPVYINKNDKKDFNKRFDYLIANSQKKESYSSGLDVHLITPNKYFTIGPFTILPLLQKHGQGQSLGFRIDDFAYNTDVESIQNIDALKGIHTWVLGCTTISENPNHLYLEKALEWIHIIRPKRVFLTHMGARMDYQTLCNTLPRFIRPCFDGMIFT